MDNVPANMSSDGLGATVTMSGIKEDKSGAAFNNPFEMVPTTGKLIKQMSSTFLSVTANQGKSTLISFYKNFTNCNFRRRRNASQAGRY